MILDHFIQLLINGTIHAVPFGDLPPLLSSYYLSLSFIHFTIPIMIFSRLGDFIPIEFKNNAHCYYSIKYWRNWWHKYRANKIRHGSFSNRYLWMFPLPLRLIALQTSEPFDAALNMLLEWQRYWGLCCELQLSAILKSY